MRSPKRLLVIGSTGLLGQEVARCGRDLGWMVTGAARRGGDVALDISDIHALGDALAEAAPDVVVNCAALVDLAECERDPGRAYQVNARPAATLAQWAGERRLLVHISTDHFFAGEGRRPKSEDEPVLLLNEYARTKFAAEAFALTSADALVLRTSIVGVRGWESDTFAEWAIRAIDRKVPLSLFADAFTSSIDTTSFARAMFELVEKGARGLLNLAAREVYSKEEFIREIARQRGRELDAQIATVPQSPIRRATALGLDVSRASRLLSQPLPSLEEVVASVLQQFNQRASHEVRNQF